MFILLLPVVIFITGCSEKTVVECVCTPFPSGDTTILKVGHKQILYDCCKDKFALTPEAVDDSRCPLQFQCVWAGTAHIKLRINQLFGEIISIELNHSKTFDYNNHTYTIKFINLSPYPVDGYPGQEDYEAAIIVSRE